MPSKEEMFAAMRDIRKKAKAAEEDVEEESEEEESEEEEDPFANEDELEGLDRYVHQNTGM